MLLHPNRAHELISLHPIFPTHGGPGGGDPGSSMATVWLLGSRLRTTRDPSAGHSQLLGGISDSKIEGGGGSISTPTQGLEHLSHAKPT